jgi:CheY-like chemotaxis protein
MTKPRLLVHEIDRKREDVVSSLHDAGYDTVFASDRQDCVKQLRTSKFDAIVLERLFDYRRRGVLDWVHELGSGGKGFVFTFDPPFAFICDFSMRNLAAPHMERIDHSEFVKRITEMISQGGGQS